MLESVHSTTDVFRLENVKDPKLRAAAKVLVATMRQRVLEQLAEWRKVPYLALRADVLHESTVETRRAWRYGWWQITTVLAIDCATGELVTFWGGDIRTADDKTRQATDEMLLAHYYKLAALDAAPVIAELTRMVKDAVGKLDEESLEERREQIEEERRTHGIDRVFTPKMRQRYRHHLTPEPYYGG